MPAVGRRQDEGRVLAGDKLTVLLLLTIFTKCCVGIDTYEYGTMLTHFSNGLILSVHRPKCLSVDAVDLQRNRQ